MGLPALTAATWNTMSPSWTRALPPGPSGNWCAPGSSAQGCAWRRAWSSDMRVPSADSTSPVACGGITTAMVDWSPISTGKRGVPSFSAGMKKSDVKALPCSSPT